MDYYTEKMMAFDALERQIKQTNGIKIEQLIYNLTKKFKIGEKTIEKRVDLLLKLDKITLNAGFLIWNNMKNLKNL